MPLAPGEVYLRPSILKWSFVTITSLMFVVIALLYFSQAGPVIEWGTIFFFGLGVIVGIMQLVPGMSYLRLAPDGFVVKSAYRTWKLIRWDSVSGFRVHRARYNKMVVFDYAGRPDRALAAVNRVIAGAQAGLPDTYGLGAEDLAALLNRWRNRALERMASV